MEFSADNKEEVTVSLSRIVFIECPLCHKEVELKMWSSINTLENPEYKDAVRDMSAFEFICPECGEKYYLDYGFLYHQMEDKIMIQYIMAEEDEDSEETDSFYDEDDEGEISDFEKVLVNRGYLYRVVFSQAELLEKLLIFDSGLDDRIIEFFKAIAFAQYLKNHPGTIKNVRLLYNYEDGKHFTEIFSGTSKVGVVDLPMAYYEKLKEKYSPYLTDIRKDEPYIDMDWALHTLINLGIKTV